MDVRQKFEAWARSFDSYRTPQREWTWLAYHAAHSSQQEEIERLRETLEIVSDCASQVWQQPDGKLMGATDNQGRRMWFITEDVMQSVRSAFSPTSASGAKEDGND